MASADESVVVSVCRARSPVRRLAIPSPEGTQWWYGVEGNVGNVMNTTNVMYILYILYILYRIYCILYGVLYSDYYQYTKTQQLNERIVIPVTESLSVTRRHQGGGSLRNCQRPGSCGLTLSPSGPNTTRQPPDKDGQGSPWSAPATVALRNRAFAPKQLE